jgi:hypothetical protein
MVADFFPNWNEEVDAALELAARRPKEIKP